MGTACVKFKIETVDTICLKPINSNPFTVIHSFNQSFIYRGVISLHQFAWSSGNIMSMHPLQLCKVKAVESNAKIVCC